MTLPRRTLLALASSASLLVPARAAQDPRASLNEIYARHDGIDHREFVELHGVPGTDLDGHLILAVDGAAGSAGTLDLAIDLTGASIPADGFFVVGAAGVANVDLVVSGPNFLRNRTQTVYLVRAPDVTAVQGLLWTNVDGDGDLATDIASVATILDRVALVDADPGLDLVLPGLVPRSGRRRGALQLDRRSRGPVSALSGGSRLSRLREPGSSRGNRRARAGARAYVPLRCARRSRRARAREWPRSPGRRA